MNPRKINNNNNNITQDKDKTLQERISRRQTVEGSRKGSHNNYCGKINYAVQ